MNVGCVVMGIPRPSHPFIKSCHIVCEIAWATMIFFKLMDEMLMDEKSMVAS